MALVRYGNGVSEIRGSIAGNVFSRNRAGAIIRNRINPINPQTQAQNDIRYLFSQVANRWTLLTLAQRESWDEFAAKVTYQRNLLGEPYQMSGRQAFQICNTNLALTSAALSGPPVTYTFDLASTLLLTADQDMYVKPAPPAFDDGDKSFNLTIAAGTPNEFQSVQAFVPPNATNEFQVILAEATPIMRAGVRNRKNKFRLLGAYDASSVAVLDILTEFLIVHPSASVATGQTAQVRMWTINRGGLASDKIEVTAVAAAA